MQLSTMISKMSISSSQNLTILITGASSGFGALTARHLARAGHKVYASMKDASTEAEKDIANFAEENKCDMRPLVLDITSEESCRRAVDSILNDGGVLDVIVHNAGHMCFGPAESFTPEQFLTYYDINCVGPQRLNRAALPHMRSRRSGLLVWVGSSSTRGGTPPFLAPYFAAKAAMDSLAVSYQIELNKFGIETAIIVPGSFTKGTNHFDNAGKPADKAVRNQYFGAGKEYEEMGGKMLKALSGLEPEWADVTVVAEKIVEVVGMQKGTRPFRTHVDPCDDGAETVNAVGDIARSLFYQRLGMPELLQVSKE